MARAFNTIGVFGDLNLGPSSSILTDFRWVGDTSVPGQATADTIRYPVGAIVAHNDLMFVALVENDNVEPGSDATMWEALGESNVVHMWSPTASYELGSLVYRREGGIATNPALLYYAEVTIAAPALNDMNPVPESNPMVPVLDADGNVINGADGMPLMQPQWISVGGGAARLTTSEGNGPFPVVKTLSDADPVTGVQTVSYTFADLVDADGNVVSGTAGVNFSEFREGLGIPESMLRGDGASVTSSAAFSFMISEAGTDFLDTARVADFVADGGAPNTLTRTDPNGEIVLSYPLRTGQSTTVGNIDIAVRSTHIVNNAVFNSGDGIKINVEGGNITFRADIRNNSGEFTNLIETDAGGLFVAPYELSAMNNVAGDAAIINIAGGAGVSSAINVITNAVATTEAAVSSVTVDVTDDGDLRVNAPPVASWAQTQEGDTANVNSIIPASKLPNLELGNTHTFDSTSHGSSEDGVIRVANEFTSAAVEDLVITRSTEPDAEDTDSVLAFPATQAATPLTAFFAGQSDYLGGPATLSVVHHQGAATQGVIEQPMTLTRFISSGFAAETGSVPITRLTPGPDYAFGTRIGWTRAGGSNDNDVTVRADGPDATRLLADIQSIGLGRNPNGIFLDSVPFTTTPSAEQVALQLAGGFQMPLGFANLFPGDTIPPFSFGVSGPVGSAANGNPYVDTMIQWAVVPQTDAVSVQILGTDAARAAQDLLDSTRGAGGRVIINSADGQTGFEAFGNFLDAVLISGAEENHLVVANPAMLASTALTRWFISGVPTISPEVSGEVRMTTAADGPDVRANPAHISSREIQTLYHGNREGFTDQTTQGLSTARTALSRTPYAQGTFIGWTRNNVNQTTILIWGNDADRVQADITGFFTGPDSRTGSGLFLEPVPIDENDRSTYLVNSITQSAIGGITATAGRSFRDAQILSLGARTAIGTRDYVDTTIRWTYEEDIDRLTLLVEGTDAVLAQMDLDAAVTAANAVGGTPIGAVSLADAADTSRDLTNTFFVNGAGDLAITNVRNYMPSTGAFDGELLHEVVQNDGEQRDGDSPIAWHPGDLLVLAGVSPDAGDNGIYVYVGVDQGTTPISPLPLPLDADGNPQTYVDPLVPTTEEVTASFGFNFRVVLNSSTELGTSVSTYEINDDGDRVTNSLGRLNSVNYSAGQDNLELVGSTSNTPVSIPLAERVADDDTRPVGGFINHIKIGGQIYRFGPTPPAPTALLSSERLFSDPMSNAFRLYRNLAQTLDYDFSATQPMPDGMGTTPVPVATLSDTGVPSVITLGNPVNTNRVEVAGPPTSITPVGVTRFFTTTFTGIGGHNEVGDADYVPAVQYSATQNADGTTTIMISGDNATQAQADILAALTADGNHRGLAVNDTPGETDLVRIAGDGDGAIVSTLVTAHELAQISGEVFTATDSAGIVGASVIDADLGVISLPAGAPQTDEDATITVEVDAILQDVNVAGISYDTSAVPSTIAAGSILSRTITLEDVRRAPSITSGAVTVNALNSGQGAITTSISNIADAGPITREAGLIYDVGGWVFNLDSTPTNLGAPSQVASHVQNVDAAFVGDIATGNAATISRSLNFAFPMVDTPMFGQPAGPAGNPPALARQVSIIRPWGWLSVDEGPGATPALPTAAQIIAAIGTGSSGRISGANTFSAGTFRINLTAGALNEYFWFVAPMLDAPGVFSAVNPNTQGGFGITRLGTIDVPTLIAGTNITYQLYRGQRVADDGTGAPAPITIDLTTA